MEGRGIIEMQLLHSLCVFKDPVHAFVFLSPFWNRHQFCAFKLVCELWSSSYKLFVFQSTVQTFLEWSLLSPCSEFPFMLQGVLHVDKVQCIYSIDQGRTLHPVILFFVTEFLKGESLSNSRMQCLSWKTCVFPLRAVPMISLVKLIFFPPITPEKYIVRTSRILLLVTGMGGWFYTVAGDRE